MGNLFDEGFAAYAKGILRSKCPHTGMAAQEWKRGWNAACYEIGDLD